MEDKIIEYKSVVAEEISKAEELLKDLTRIKESFDEMDCLTEEWLSARHREAKGIAGDGNAELEELFSGPLAKCWGLSKELFETFSQVMLFHEFRK